MIEFTASDGVWVALISICVALWALYRASAAGKKSDKLEADKVDVLRRIADLYEVRGRGKDETQVALKNLAGRLLSQLLTLPYPEPNDRLIRTATLWNGEDLSRLESLAATAGQVHASNAAKAVKALTFLSSTVQSVQSVNPTLGYDYKKFPKRQWQQDYPAAQQALEALTHPSGEESPESNVDIHLSGDRIYIDSVGDLPARDITLTFQSRGGQSRSPLVSGDADEKLPIPVLEPGETCPLIAALSNDCYPPFDVTLVWTDDECEEGEHREKSKVLYGD